MGHSGISPFLDEILPDYDRVKQYFLGKVGCEHEAADLTQETFARLSKWQPTKEVEHPQHVLFRTARNLLVDRFRAPRIPTEALADSRAGEIADQSADPSQLAMYREQLRRVSRAAASLPDPCREIFVLHRLLGLDYEQIGKTLGLSTSTVKRHMAFALLTCKGALNDDQRSV